MKIRFLKYELEKMMGEVSSSEFFEERNAQFMRFINPSKSMIEKQKEEEEANKNEFSLSQIKLQDVCSVLLSSIENQRPRRIVNL